MQYPRIDSHIHLGLHTGPLPNHDSMIRFVRSQMENYRTLGILYLRDGGDRRGLCLLARELAPEYGIVYKTPVYALYKRGTYGELIGQSFNDSQTNSFGTFQERFSHAFHALLQKKPDHLKIPLTGIVSIDPSQPYGKIGETAFSRRELAYIIDSARDHNLPVMVHANGEDAVRMAAELGATTIEHGYFSGEPGLQAMAEHGTIWVPTLAPFGNLCEQKPPRLEAHWSVIQKVYIGQQKALERALKLGVKIALGSDAGAFCVPCGQGYFDEIRHFESIGLRKDCIDRMAAENGALALGINTAQ